MRNSDYPDMIPPTIYIHRINILSATRLNTFTKAMLRRAKHINKLYKYADLNLFELPVFLDVHNVPLSEDHLKELCESPRDEFGVTHVNLFYNKEANVCFCLLDAPDVAAVENHHDKAGVKCEWITEVSMAKLPRIS